MPGTGMCVGYEVHGANTKFVNNTVRNAYRGIWVAENMTAESTGILVANNRFDGIRGVGVEVFGAAENTFPARRVLIADNVITLNALTLPEGQSKAGIQIGSNVGQRDITIRGNRIQGSPAFRCDGVTVIAQEAFENRGKHTNIDVDNNTTEGALIGVNIRSAQKNGIGHLKITRNRLINPVTVDGDSPMGVAVGFDHDDLEPSFQTVKPIDSLVIRDNEVVLDSPLGVPVRGVRLAGHLLRLDYANNATRNVQIDLEEVVGRCEIIERRGDFPIRAFIPTFKAGGTVITLGNGSVNGTWSMAKGQVTMTAKLTVGSTTVFPAGGITVDLPIVSGFAGVQYMGQARIFDTSASIFTFVETEIDGTAAIAALQVTGGTNVGSTAPVTLASGDIVSIHIGYASPTA